MRAAPLLWLATSATLIQQAFAAYAKTVVPVIAPDMAAGLGVEPAPTGAWVAIAALAGIPTTLFAGGLVRRYGPLRTSSAATAVMAAGLALGAVAPSGHSAALALQALSAFIVGAGSTVSTPASSHLLARLCPPRHAAMVFSIKQTGVPLGVAMAGALGPPLVHGFGWQGALAASALMNLALAALLEPLRGRFDDDRDPDARVGLADMRATLAGTLRHPGLRLMSFTSFIFVGLQITVQSFLVVQLVSRVGYDLALAGWVFSAATMVAIPARIIWGWVGGATDATRLLATFGGLMFASCAALGLLPPAAPVWLSLSAAVAASATALAWHGVLLAEVARMAPRGQVGAMTGGVLTFAGLGQIVLPGGFGALIAAGVGFPLAWPLVAAPALGAGWMIWRSRRATGGGDGRGGEW